MIEKAGRFGEEGESAVCRRKGKAIWRELGVVGKSKWGKRKEIAPSQTLPPNPFQVIHSKHQ